MSKLNLTKFEKQFKEVNLSRFEVVYNAFNQI